MRLLGASRRFAAGALVERRGPPDQPLTPTRRKEATNHQRLVLVGGNRCVQGERGLNDPQGTCNASSRQAHGERSGLMQPKEVLLQKEAVERTIGAMTRGDVLDGS